MPTIAPPVLPYQALERAQRGAQVLDQIYPGWRDEISLDRLDIGAECNCVLGQLHGSYSDAWTDLDLFMVGALYDETETLEDFSTDHGFNRHEGDDDSEYDALNDAWHYVIAG